MHTTKRKLSELLQGLHSSQVTSDKVVLDCMDDGHRIHSTKGNDSPFKKRQRLALNESLSPPHGPRVQTLHHTALVPHASTVSCISGQGEPSARYCPGEREELLLRLGTFQSMTNWTPKPDEVNEVEWAKRGWVCQGKETVRCVLCRRELLVKLQPTHEEIGGQEGAAGTSERTSKIWGFSGRQSAYRFAEVALQTKYYELMTTAHQQNCPWKSRGCDDNLLRVSFANTQSVLSSLKLRYAELYARESFLPAEHNIRFPENIELDQLTMKLPVNFFVSVDPEVEIPGDRISTAGTTNLAALALALTGWQGLSNVRIGAVANSISCHTCLRRLGLWMFKAKEVKEVGKGCQILAPAPMGHLDPIREHRFFCPWRNHCFQRRSDQSPTDNANAPAWRILIQTINNDANLRRVYGSALKAPATQYLSGQNLPSSARAADCGSGSFDSMSSDTSRNLCCAYEDKEIENQQLVKEKERWARLKKVKNLLDVKGAEKLRHSIRRT